MWKSQIESAGVNELTHTSIQVKIENDHDVIAIGVQLSVGIAGRKLPHWPHVLFDLGRMFHELK